MEHQDRDDTLVDELPSAMGQDFADELAGRRPAVFLDFDGTLTAIVARADMAVLSGATRSALEHLAARCPVAIVSGRDREDVVGRVGLEGVYYAGSHGFDISGPAGLHHEKGGEFRTSLVAAADEVDEAIEGISGAWVERKKFAASVHYRQASPDSISEIERAVRDVAARFDDLRVGGGKMIFELRPAIEWDKGRAVMWLLEVMDPTGDDVVAIYLGDDETDEDVFREFQGGEGIGVVVGLDRRPTRARYSLADPEEVTAFLRRLAGTATRPWE